MNDKQGNLSNLLLNFSFIDQKKYRILCRTEKKNGNESAFLQRRNYLKTIENLRWTICFHRHLHLQLTTNNFFLRYFTRNNWKEKKKEKTELLPSYCKILTIIPRILINVHAHVPSNETLYEFIRQEFPYRGGESLVEAHASSNETTTSE